MAMHLKWHELNDYYKVAISITTTDKSIRTDLVGATNSKVVTDGIEVRYEKETIHEAIAFPETYTFLVFIAQNVALPTAVGVLSSYIYDVLKGKPDAKLKIGEIDVHIDKGEIDRIIMKKIEVTK